MKKGGKTKRAVAIGAAAVAAGTAAYMLLGPNGKKNRAKVKAFAKKVKKNVADNKNIRAAVKAVAKVAKSATTKAKAGVKKAKVAVKKTVKSAVSKAKRATR